MALFQTKSKLGLSDAPVQEATEAQETPVTNVQPKSIEMERSIPKESSENLNAVLERLNRLEAENKQMKEEQEKIRLSDTATIIKARKERYQGPRKYSYKLIDGKPITDLKTVSNQVRKDYKEGGYHVDQKVELIYADGSKEIMGYDVFSQSFERSEKKFIDSQITKDGKTRYVFKDGDMEFSVAENVIN